MSRDQNKTRPRALTVRQSSGEELIRVRIDAALKSVAESVCREHELTLPEVPRTVVRRIAMIAWLPFADRQAFVNQARLRIAERIEEGGRFRRIRIGDPLAR